MPKELDHLVMKYFGVRIMAMNSQVLCWIELFGDKIFWYRNYGDEFKIMVTFQMTKEAASGRKKGKEKGTTKLNWRNLSQKKFVHLL